MNDDELERLLRESNPASTPSEVGLSANHRAILERIVAEPVGRRRSPARLTLMVTAPLAAVLAIFVVVISVFQPFAPAPAAAFGPPPLEYQPTSRSAEEAIRLAQGRLEQQQSVTEPLRQAVTTAWNLTIAEDGQAEPTVVISPSVTELEWAADLSGSLKVVAGEPYFADGNDVAVATDEANEAGTVLDERTFAPGEFPAQIPDAASLEPAALDALLAAFAPDRSLAGDAFLAMHAVLNEWTLTNAQHSALLHGLSDYENITVLGTTTDRAGRDVVGLKAATSRPGQDAVLLVSASSGRIVGLESSVTSNDNSLEVPEGTVISYTLWKDQE
ncbi:hypothetical protein [Microbacterium sp. CFBP9034]|jgi:hypothetical protein|uniref:hypothetical protein n=1 Tax=Microbacterium sp. CFBP9034 TaxID=3096540 RepID=UPI002A6B8796|nr:hypothetical protein [Microbacterium sp. CFBP9034]MDY0910725.1 hypothetical protein [Microbacterium sp. CFBP9034]